VCAGEQKANLPWNQEKAHMKYRNNDGVLESKLILQQGRRFMYFGCRMEGSIDIYTKRANDCST
jgi:hypothetical protein